VTALDAMIADPSAWLFSFTDEESTRVREAYVGYQASYGHVPDVDALRACLMGGFDGDVAGMLRFWDVTLLADMPNLGDIDAGIRGQVEDKWREQKLAHIAASLGLEPLVSWDRESLSAALKAPQHLRAVADRLEQLETDGFSLSSCEVDDDLVATWHLRRQQRRMT
jgi:hypothetical protein